jgi:preprotein translocase subunit SecF
MRELIRDTRIDFMRHGRVALIISGTLVLLAIVLFVVRGMSWGLDFTGGTMVEVGYPESVAIPEVRATLAAAGFDDAQAQHFGTSREVLIRIPPRGELDSADLSGQVLAALRGDNPDVEMRRVEFVGPQVGEELVEQGGLAMLYALIGIMIYVTLRFEWRLALGTIMALSHDALIVIGLFSLFQIEFDLTVLAAILAIIGYSVNDSVVVLDRIRENFRRMRKGTILDIVNASVNQTLSRTVVTSGTTLLAVLALLFLGGPVMNNFALALMIGVLVGTYSSIYVATAGAVWLGLKREDMIPPKPKQEVDDMP